MDQHLKFSLIIGTINRPKILAICLDKIKNQTYKDFEVIIVDQSNNKETESLVSTNLGINVKYSRVNFKGLSKARNEAISLMSGNYFCLIDDDADYSNDYLANAAEIIKKKPDVIISGYILNTYTGKGIVDYGKIRHSDGLTLREIIRFCPSAGLIIPASAINKVGNFDERFGVGAQFGATEETDYLIRCRKAGYTIIHNDQLFVEHPILLEEKQRIEPVTVAKIKSYAMGGGALYKKHIYYGKEYELFPMLVDSIGRTYIKRVLQNNEASKVRHEGFIEGWRRYIE